MEPEVRSTPGWTFATCNPLGLFWSQIIDSSKCHKMCVPVSTGKLFIKFLVLTDKTHAAISCGEKTNLSDAVSLALWPLSLIPQGCICMRTDRGHRFPLGLRPLCSGKLHQLALITREKHQQVKCWSPCLVSVSAPGLPDSPAFNH